MGTTSPGGTTDDNLVAGKAKYAKDHGLNIDTTMRDYGYSYIASTKPDGQCFVIVPKGSALKTIDEVKGKRIALPEQIAYMRAKSCRWSARSSSSPAMPRAASLCRAR